MSALFSQNKLMLRVSCIVVFTLLFSCFYAERIILASQNQYYNTQSWEVNGVASDDELLTVRLFLYQHNLETLNTEFERRTNPQSDLWRKWLSNEEIQRIVSPPKEDIEVVLKWVREYENVRLENHGDCILIEAPVKTINAMFQTTLYSFTHKESGVKVARHYHEYSLPSGVLDKVQFVLGINGFPFVGRSFAHKHLQLEDETYKVVPYVIDQLYNIDYNLASKITQKSTVGVAEFEDNRAFNSSDLAYFQSQNLLPNNPVPEHQIIGPFNPKLPNVESTLDIQYAGGVSYNTSNWYYTVRGWMLEFADILNAANSYPYAISMSWGWTEDNQCEITSCTSSSEYVARCNVEFQKVGLKGITLIASSGDQGAPGDGNPDCFNNKEPISSIFPGASPYVLSVGATMLVTPSEVSKSKRDSQPVPPICETQTCADPSQLVEVACSYPDALITTGGGFSVYSPRPSWQDSVVSQYIASSSALPNGYYNVSNRGFPDVSALGHNYLIQISGIWELVDGTSCSAPVWAALVGLLNQYEIDAGRSPLGFINPLIYQAYSNNSNIFFDIVNGNNLCTESNCCEYGYPTASGWDAVTGLGTPNFELLLNYIQSLSN